VVGSGDLQGCMHCKTIFVVLTKKIAVAMKIFFCQINKTHNICQCNKGFLPNLQRFICQINKGYLS